MPQSHYYLIFCAVQKNSVREPTKALISQQFTWQRVPAKESEPEKNLNPTPKTSKPVGCKNRRSQERSASEAKDARAFSSRLAGEACFRSASAQSNDRA
jgi:hypothetical protein